MASKLIGRHECPWCGFAAAHVKQSERCVYTFCPECGIQTHFRAHQEPLIRDRMRQEKGAEPAAPAPAEVAPELPAPEPAPEPASETRPPAAQAGRRRLFSSLGG